MRKCDNGCGRVLDEFARLKRPANEPKKIVAWCEACSIWFPSNKDEGPAEVDDGLSP